MMTTDVKNPRGRNEDVPRGRGQIIRKHVLRSIQRNNKRVRNAKHVEKDTKLCKEFDSTFSLFFFKKCNGGVTDVVVL